MPSAKTFLNIVNESPFDFTIQVSEITNSDWDGVSRPDNNFHNVKIASGQSKQEREEVNTSNRSHWFTMLLVFSNGDRCSFRNDQGDAFTNNNRVYKTERCWEIYQNCRNNTNNIYIRFRPQPAEVEATCKWMSRIPDGVGLCGITIPGTHDSGTTNGVENLPGQAAVVANLLVVTQNMSITDQLKAGIRFLDIRVNNAANRCNIQHGEFGIANTSFESVLNECKRFLADYPSEIIIMSVKEEDPQYSAQGIIGDVTGLTKAFHGKNYILLFIFPMIVNSRYSSYFRGFSRSFC
jgi:hypothetical protein